MRANLGNAHDYNHLSQMKKRNEFLLFNFNNMKVMIKILIYASLQEFKEERTNIVCIKCFRDAKPLTGSFQVSKTMHFDSFLY